MIPEFQIADKYFKVPIITIPNNFNDVKKIVDNKWKGKKCNEDL